MSSTSDFSVLDDCCSTIGSAFALIIGVLLHLLQLSIVELGYAEAEKFVPNAASVLMTFSVLSNLNRLRPFWPSRLQHPPKLIKYILELLVMLYITDFTMRQGWVPVSKTLELIFIVLSKCVVPEQYEVLEDWIRFEVFFVARFILALSVFYSVVDTSAITNYLPPSIRKLYLCRIIFNLKPADVKVTSSQRRHTSTRVGKMKKQTEPVARCLAFNPAELPVVPPEDLLSMGNFVGVRRRRRPASHPRPRASDILPTFGNETSC